MMVVGRGNGAGIWGGGQHRAPGEAPLSEFPNDPPQRSELYNGGSSIMATGALRSTAPQPLLPSIADVLRGAAAGLPSLLGSAMAAGIFAPQPKPPMLPPTIAPFASVSPAASSPQPDFTTASNSSPAHPLLPQRAASSTTGSSAQDSGSRGSAAVAAPLASARPLQALAFEEFLREKHLAVHPNPHTPHPTPYALHPTS
ncbi:hypothetical protein T484DRAFT_3645394 [Baffinella frigidus]|nr:hypothetical protein T484DRAFT_3645394 [Cryptophyta sp. CCMP2293]